MEATLSVRFCSDDRGTPTKVRATDMSVKPEDVQRLSPLLLDHVNVLGRYDFALKESIRQGQLRPLREPKETDDLAA
jgi:hypothetical protein